MRTIEVREVNEQGVCLVLGQVEYLLRFEDFPWFREATFAEISNVESMGEEGLHWPDLDLHLHLDALSHPERFPVRWSMPAFRRALSERRRRGEDPTRPARSA